MYACGMYLNVTRSQYVYVCMWNVSLCYGVNTYVCMCMICDRMFKRERERERKTTYELLTTDCNYYYAQHTVNTQLTVRSVVSSMLANNNNGSSSCCCCCLLLCVIFSSNLWIYGMNMCVVENDIRRLLKK